MTVTDHGVCADIRVTDFGSIWLLTPLSADGQEWIESNTDPAALYWGRSLVVEPRYIPDLVEGAAGDGLVIA